MGKRYAPLLLLFVLGASCTKQEGSNGPLGPHARVKLRDGTWYSGMIAGSSATQVTLSGDDHVTHILAMKDVQSINYDDAPPQSPDLSHEDHYHPPESVISTKTYDLPVGTQIAVRCEETIDSAKAAEGQTYAAEVAKDVLDANAGLVIPRGANAQIVIRSASKGGRFHGTSDLILDLDSVSIDGRRYRLSTTDLVERGKPGMGANKRTAEYTGGGAVVGAIIGAIAGGGKGAAIGAGSGAGAGAVTQAITKGGSIKVPAESLLTFKLDKPLHAVAAQ